MSKKNIPPENKKHKKSSIISTVISILLSLIGLGCSIAAIILSQNANDFAKDISPLTYSFEVKENIAQNIVPSETADISFNVSNIKINIDNEPGKISNIYIAYVYDNDAVDIRSCEPGIDKAIVFDKSFMLKYNYDIQSKTTIFSTGFSRLDKEKFGYFFIILKSYSGDYYYNIIHYITDDETYLDEESKLYFVDTKTNGLKISEIYDQEEMKSLCNDINNKKYIEKPIELNEYINQLENDYKFLKSKLEG